jgi:hypothetical protein
VLDRVTASRHFQTFIGFCAATLGIVTALCFVVGVAVVLDAIVKVIH